MVLFILYLELIIRNFIILYKNKDLLIKIKITFEKYNIFA